jgi:23S rRNA pseudouridine2605 synthase
MAYNKENGGDKKRTRTVNANPAVNENPFDKTKRAYKSDSPKREDDDRERKPYVSREGSDSNYNRNDGERKPFVKREGSDRSFNRNDGERKPWENREGGERKPFVKREGGNRTFNRNDGERKPWENREGGERKPFVKREGSDRTFNRNDGERKPWENREGGERKPFVKREGSDRTFNRNDGERKPWENREGGERKPFVKREGSDRSFNRNDSERKPWENREGGERKPFVKRESGDRTFNRNDGERKPWENREGGERKPFVKRESGDRTFNRNDGERKPWDNREGGERKPFQNRDNGSNNFKGTGYGSSRPNAKKEFEDKTSAPWVRKLNKPENNESRLPKKLYERKQDLEARDIRGDNYFTQNFDINKNKPKALTEADKELVRRLEKKRNKIEAEFQESRKLFEAEKTHTKSSFKKIVRTEDPEEQMPLNKYVARCGVASRRESVELIKAGKIKINGHAQIEPSHRVEPTDKVTYNDKEIKPQNNMVYVLLNKPKDFITTSDDEKGRHTVMDLVATACDERIYPVGRLDRNTSGLLLMTNDGDLAQKLSHPKYTIKKLYQVNLDKNLSNADYTKITKGIELEDGIAEVDELAYVDDNDKSKIGIQIHSGKNRIVRRIFESLGYEVKQLDRVMYANLTKKNLPRGKWRYLNETEVKFLKHFNS